VARLSALLIPLTAALAIELSPCLGMDHFAPPMVASQPNLHLTLVCDARFGGRAKFYVDGRPAGDDFLSLGMPLDLYHFRIGGWNRWETIPANNFHGELDNLRIYGGMLTGEEIVEMAAEEPDKPAEQ
jgi:concanavalin A-like lectin/glucanase superfamily protein